MRSGQYVQRLRGDLVVGFERGEQRGIFILGLREAQNLRAQVNAILCLGQLGEALGRGLHARVYLAEPAEGDGSNAHDAMLIGTN